MTVTTTLRHSTCVKRLATASVIAGQLLTATPLLAQDVAKAAVRASSRAAGDLQRTVAKQRIKVNRTVPKVTAPSLEVAFGIHVTTDALRRAHVFAEPLLPTAIPNEEDNRVLGALLQTYATIPEDQRLVRIDQFLADRPASPWRASVLANAATSYARAGYFSRAAAYWEQAWELTRDATAGDAKAIADYSLGEMLTQMVSFGQVERIQQRLSDIDARDVRGPAGTKVSAARIGLSVLTNHHELAMFSGPEALKMYLTVAPTETLEKSVRAIAAYHPSMAGTRIHELRDLAASAGLRLEVVHAAPVGDIPVPSVVHFRSQHFAAIVAMEGDKYVLRDPSLGGTLRLTGAALRDETSGYFLVSPEMATSSEWRAVSDGEAPNVVGHCAPGGASNNDPPKEPPPPPPTPPPPDLCLPQCGGPGPGETGGMPYYSFHPVSAALIVEDVPLSYTPPVGPAVHLKLSYNHRDSRQPQTLTYGNVGPLWTFDSLAYVTDNLYQILPPYVSATVFLRGHGKEWYEGNYPITHPISRAQLIKVSDDPPRYERHLPDGTIEVYALPDRAASLYNRQIFLTQLIDPQGHALTYSYDSAFRLVAITDAIGQVTTLEYLDTAEPLRLTRITDPFGRVATISYDALGRIETLTDVATMTSRFSYGAGDFVAAMTTPYGTTTFRHEPILAGYQALQRIEATDPAGGTERLEFHFNNDAFPATESSSVVPTGFSASNTYLDRYNSIYWDKQAMAMYPGDLTKGVITNWMLKDDIGGWHPTSRNIPHSIKRPLENRVWYRYPDQGSISHHTLVWGRHPALIGRVLDGGASQISQFSYNTKGMVTSEIDPLGRQTNYTYATNGIDLLSVEQVRSGGTDVVRSYTGYNVQHRPETVTDAAGQDTTLTYNAAGQPLTVTNAKAETTTFAYQTGTGSLLSVTGPVSGATAGYSYDAYGRVETATRVDGYAVTYDYDALNRTTQVTYPDATIETMTYSRLDLLEQKDRLGRITRHVYDGYGRRIATRDPAGRTVSLIWCDCDQLDALVDANGNRTRWERDVQGRVTREVRADDITDTLYNYDLAGRLKTVTDPKDQITTYSYNLDDTLQQVAFTNATIATPSISYTYDPDYPRMLTMVDGVGTTTYAYKAVATAGALGLASVDGPFSSDTITYTYDALGRVMTRLLNGTGTAITYDALGRISQLGFPIGNFAYTFDGHTGRTATVTYPNSQTTTYSHLGPTGDHRLQTIHHKTPGAATLSKFDYTYDAVGNILTWRQERAGATTQIYTFGHDLADQLTSAVLTDTNSTPNLLKRQGWAYDPAGNRTVDQNDDAVFATSHDSLNRLQSRAPGGPHYDGGHAERGGDRDDRWESRGGGRQQQFHRHRANRIGHDHGHAESEGLQRQRNDEAVRDRRSWEHDQLYLRCEREPDIGWNKDVLLERAESAGRSEGRDDDDHRDV